MIGENISHEHHINSDATFKFYLKAKVKFDILHTDSIPYY